ncbi:MAG UNVERIFIED_CONTAM: SAM-dependent methyltransferase [Planctomycetaceae bacterium]
MSSLANPPYSIKQWDRDAFAADPWGRNLYGTPPQGRADYAFWQHIQCSLTPKSGRLCDSVSAWRSVPSGRGGDASQDD